MKLLILSDIHGNLSALDAVLTDVKNRGGVEAVALLGDYIDYGMRSNEVIERLKELDVPFVCSLWGNHEQSIIEELWDRYSSPRGAVSAQNTAKHLNSASRDWLMGLSGRSGYQEFEYDGVKFLAVHGSLEDVYWKAIQPGTICSEDYADYDVVLSGHNHIPHYFEAYTKVDNPKMRNKKKTAFINPGSVGQPRNHNPRAQYAIWDPRVGVSLLSVEYDIAHEQSLFDGSIDVFYRDRLSVGV